MFSAEILKQNDSIINCSYDCILEGVLDYVGVGVPRNGYTRISAFPTDSVLLHPKQIAIHSIDGSENLIESSAMGTKAFRKNKYPFLLIILDIS